MRLDQVSAGLGDFAACEALLNGVFVEIDVDGFTLDEGGRLVLEDNWLRLCVDDWLFVDWEGLLMTLADSRLVDGWLGVIVDGSLVLSQFLRDDFLVDRVVNWLSIDWLHTGWLLFINRLGVQFSTRMLILIVNHLIHLLLNQWLSFVARRVSRPV